MIDTLRLARHLQDAGLPPAQAEAVARGFNTEAEDHLASRRDIEELRQAVDRIKGELREMRRRLECFPHKLAKLMIAQGGLIAGLVVFLERLLKP